MKIINKLTAVCGSAILSLSLISCNGEDAVIKAPAGAPWGLGEPIIKSGDGNEIKYSEANTKAGQTFSIDDQLEIKDITGEVHLKFYTSCIRNGDRFNYSDLFAAKSNYNLVEFMPQEALYSKDQNPLAGVTCSIEMMAIHQNGSKQRFPALNIVMNNISLNRLELIQGLRPFKSDELNIVQANDLEQVLVPQISGEETLKLQCDTLNAYSTDKYVRNLSDLKVTEGVLSGEEQLPQVCRVFKTLAQRVLAVSPFFTIRFFNPIGILAENDDSKMTATLLDGRSIINVNFRRQKIFNPRPHSIFLRFMKKFKTVAMVQTPWFKYPWDTSVSVKIHGGKLTHETNDYFVVQLAAKDTAILTYSLDSYIICRGLIASLTVQQPSSPTQVKAVDSTNKNILSEWDLITELFKPYVAKETMKLNESADQLNPQGCVPH